MLRFGALGLGLGLERTRGSRCLSEGLRFRGWWRALQGVGSRFKVKVLGFRSSNFKGFGGLGVSGFRALGLGHFRARFFEGQGCAWVMCPCWAIQCWLNKTRSAP